MTSRRRPKISRPPQQDPTPTPILGKEEDEAKKKVRQRRGGRESTRLAGMMMSRNGNILKTKLG